VWRWHAGLDHSRRQYLHHGRRLRERGFNHLKLEVVGRIIRAWVLTLPISGGAAYRLVCRVQMAGWIQ